MWRDIDPRDDERDRPDLSRGSSARPDDSASTSEESGDALTRELDLPRGSTRRPVKDRDRLINLRESEVRMLATAGAFRVVVASDLRDQRGPAEHDASPRGKQVEDVELLLRQFHEVAAHTRLTPVRIERDIG